MQHATKMVMVPQEVYNSLLSRQQESTEPLVAQLSNLDQQARDILSVPGVPADIKYGQYNQTLHRYRHLKEEQRKPLHVRLDQPAPAAMPVPIQNLIEGIPPRHRAKARILMDHLMRHPSDFKWSDRGELVMAGKEIPGSSIVDLVHDFVRPRNAVAPATGAEEFSALLRQTNAPREGVGNPERQFQAPVLGTPYSPASRRSHYSSASDEDFMETVSATPKKKKKPNTPKISKRSPPVVLNNADVPGPSKTLIGSLAGQRTPRIRKPIRRFDESDFSNLKQ